jgi:uncharacterized membrane protein
LKSKDNSIATTIAPALRGWRAPQLEVTVGALGLLVCGTVPALADEPSYSLIQVQLPAGFSNPHGGGINNLGDIAFTASTNGQAGSRAFVWAFANGHASELGTLGGNNSSATSVNDCGIAVGSATLKGDKVTHATLFSHGSVIDLDPHQASKSFAAGINNHGTAVGASFVASDNNFHPMVFSGGTVRDLTGQPGQAVGINLSGQIAGFNSRTQANNFLGGGFLIENGQTTTFLHGPNDATQAVAINDFGDVLGVAVLGASSSSVSFLWQEGSVFSLPGFGLASTPNQQAVALNNSGEVVATNQGPQPSNPFFAALIRGNLVGELTDLVDHNDPLEPFVDLTRPFGVNDSGWIAAEGTDTRDHQTHIYLLKQKTPAIQVERVKGGCPSSDSAD